MANQVDVEVPDALDGARVDKTVAELFSVSRAVAADVVASGVEVDGAPARASDRVRGGQILRCEPPAAGVPLRPEPVDFTVVHEDEDVIVVDKPTGIVVHPGSGRIRGTLAAGLIHRFPELEGVGAADRWGLVHRLDKDTSGVLLVARTPDAFRFLSNEMRQRRVERIYTALVEGRMPAPTGTVDAPVGRDPKQPTRRAVAPNGKPARTHYEVIRYYEGADACLLELRLETGRTHQIRVHMAAIDHPVVGDLTYGATRRDLGVPRTWLHATRVEFTHPTSGERVQVEAPLPTDLVTIIDRLS